ncbi:hypothetical protein [Synechococcus elongatus]|uniref:hypothetical protein n=1 Tax=Synechococcus elongatus TaxID=32046 RepID=UPI003CC81473
MTLDLQADLKWDERIARSQQMLTAVGLGDHLDYYPENLSGGKTAGGDRPRFSGSSQTGAGR